MATPFTNDELRRAMGDRTVLSAPATRRRVAAVGDDPRARLLGLTATLERGEPVDADEVQALAEALEAAGDAEGAAWAYRVTSDVLLRAARFEESLVSVEAALAVAPEDFPAIGALLVRRSMVEQRSGALPAAVRSVRNGYARAVGAGDEVTARWAVAYLATYSLQIGHLRRAEALAERVLEDHGAEPAGALPSHLGPMTSMGWVVRAMVAAARGAWHEATDAFDEAERVCAEQSPWFAWIVRTYRGAALARYEPPMADEVLDELRAHAPDAGPELAWRFAHATGVAMSYHGALDDGVARMRAALADAEPRWERAVIALQLGEVLTDAGRHDEAAEVLRDAADAFEAMDAPYWLARAWVGLARVLPEVADGYLAGARSFDDGDPAYGRLFEHRERLWIDVGKSPSVLLGEERVAFAGRQAEFTVYALALAGDAGVVVGELVEVLWPSPDPARVPQRIRTLLWQVRKALGPESWRLQRVGDVVRLDLRGAHVAGLEPDTLLVELRASPPATSAATNGAGALAPGEHLLADWDHLGEDAQRWARALLTGGAGATPATEST